MLLFVFSFIWLFYFTSGEDYSYSCDENLVPENERNNWHLRGTNLGGWLVLEPWITPSLFYQFLGAYEKWGEDASNHVAFDCYSFCKVLGATEANKQLRRHWQTWLTEDHIRFIASTNVDTLRIPVGDWMFVPYQPYIDCFDGSLEELDRAIDLAEKYHLKVLIDIHAMKGGQNAFDNSGYSVIEWTSPTTFNHILTAGWIGEYNLANRTMTVNPTSIEHGLQVIQKICDLYKDRSNIIGIEAVNEPLYDTPMDALKDFYWKAYTIIQQTNPNWISIFHDSFKLNLNTWGGFMKNCPNFAIDSHMYLAWQDDSSLWSYGNNACNRIYDIVSLESSSIPVIIGEWSLATDNCAMWLQGFNNNLYGYPRKKCDMIKCPDPYMGFDQPGFPIDFTKGAQDPFGSGGISTPIFGMCPTDASFESNDQAMLFLGKAQLQVFESSHGQFFWNFRTEIEPKWSYIEAVKNGWLPKFWSSDTLSTFNLCKISGGLQESESSISPISYESSPTISWSFVLFMIILLCFGVAIVILIRFHVSKHFKYSYVQISQPERFYEVSVHHTNLYQHNPNISNDFE